MSVREKTAMEEAGKVLKGLIEAESVSISDAFEAVNQQMSALQQPRLKFKNFKAVVDDAIRSNECVQRGDMLSKP